MRRAYVRISTSLAFFALVGCAATRQAAVEERSGFLGSSYGLLRKGTDMQAQLVYVNPNADFKSYRKVYLAPVVVVRSKGSNLAGYSKDDIKAIADKTYSAFAEDLSKQFQLVESPQPGAMKVELAITEVDRSEPVLDTITSVIPQARLLSGVKTVVTGKASFVGEASGEGKITDAMTGELLFAGMDRRVGTKNLSGITDSWNDFDSAIDFWAKRLNYNLCIKQGRPKCDEPSA